MDPPQINYINHNSILIINPKGKIRPSIHDKEITKKIQSACNFLDIKFLDHIIISPSGTYLSFADEGIL